MVVNGSRSPRESLQQLKEITTTLLLLLTNRVIICNGNVATKFVISAELLIVTDSVCNVISHSGNDNRDSNATHNNLQQHLRSNLNPDEQSHKN